MSNCLFEATLQRVESECGCTPKNFISVVDGFEPCSGLAKKCMKDLMQARMMCRFQFRKMSIADFFFSKTRIWGM